MIVARLSLSLALVGMLSWPTAASASSLHGLRGAKSLREARRARATTGAVTEPGVIVLRSYSILQQRALLPTSFREPRPFGRPRNPSDPPPTFMVSLEQQIVDPDDTVRTVVVNVRNDSTERQRFLFDSGIFLIHQSENGQILGHYSGPRPDHYLTLTLPYLNGEIVSSDGSSTLIDEPHVVSLAPGESVTLEKNLSREFQYGPGANYTGVIFLPSVPLPGWSPTNDMSQRNLGAYFSDFTR